MAHPSDHELLMESDGELEAVRAAAVRRHLDTCPSCRQRQSALANALATATNGYLQQPLPPPDASRIRLAASFRPRRRERFLAVGALAAALALLLFPLRSDRDPAAPRAALTPGAVRTVNLAAMCAAADEGDRPVITPALAQEVFRRYGIYDPRPRAYEVDYLIPPDLGGSNEVKNLWPQSYSDSVWNARVKDALEDRLRTMVCGGSLDLAVAQQELAADWVGAYKRHFHTAQPLPDHLAFVKDQPWE
ncbi:MAG TPA: zf-HC2 domain-containing protein [Bryobacteraceae bacterium]|nr:zf-HC2 domain-containing protein [Bryobacteraceae bacterium]